MHLSRLELTVFGSWEWVKGVLFSFFSNVSIGGLPLSPTKSKYLPICLSFSVLEQYHDCMFEFFHASVLVPAFGFGFSFLSFDARNSIICSFVLF